MLSHTNSPNISEHSHSITINFIISVDSANFGKILHNVSKNAATATAKFFKQKVQCRKYNNFN